MPEWLVTQQGLSQASVIETLSTLMLKKEKWTLSASVTRF